MNVCVCYGEEEEGMTGKVTSDGGTNDLLGGSKRVDDRDATCLSNRVSIKAAQS